MVQNPVGDMVRQKKRFKRHRKRYLYKVIRPQISGWGTPSRCSLANVENEYYQLLNSKANRNISMIDISMWNDIWIGDPFQI